MNRRDFLRWTGLAAANAAFSRRAAAARTHPIEDGSWRQFEITTRVEVLRPAGRTRVWLPAPLVVDTPFQKPLGNTFNADGGTATFVEDRASALGMVVAEWPDGVKPRLTLTSRAATRDYAVDLSRVPQPGKADKADKADRAALAPFLRPTKLLPTDGIVKATALEITRSAKTDLARARAIYQWIVENTFRDPATRGCGIGDIRFMLESKSLGGKCADLNALYVGLARAAGLPARDAYGIRVAKSAHEYRSLGVASETISRAQHCRAEVYVTGYGWVPVDPADVRKVMLEEPPGHLPADHALVRAAQARLFGSWEMNWIAYNFAHDVALPGSSGAPIGFLMYPQAETAQGRLDSLDPDGFAYEIVARELRL